MSNWRDVIMSKFQNQKGSLIFVHDKDALLNEEIIVAKLRDIGYDVIRFDDSITFHYLYEHQYRGKESDYKLLVYANEDIFLPFEFEKRALKLTININTIFPKFSFRIMRQINREDFDDLYQLHEQYYGKPNDSDTLKYLVRYYYKIPYEIIDNEADLYKILLSIHYNKKELPPIIQKFLLESWENKSNLSRLPLKKFLSSSATFFQYLEEKWAVFVKEINPFQIKESMDLVKTHPFADPDVRRLMNDLFMEGILKRVKSDPRKYPVWMRAGIEGKENNEDNHQRILYLYEKISKKLLESHIYKDWFDLLDLVGEYYRLVKIEERDQNDDKFQQLLIEINRKFELWMMEHYHSLISLPPYPKPKLVHHIPHYLNHQRHANEKIALLVLDGMSFIQWKIIGKYLSDNGFSISNEGIFAWIPTITSVSRQAIFSGKIPMTFDSTIHTTSSEEKLWKNYWEEQGILKQYIAYQKGLGNEKYRRENIKALINPSTKIYGAVIDVIDKLTHTAVFGEKAIITNLSLWMESNYLVNFINDLIHGGFKVYITSDHGNTIAEGIGRVSEGVLVDKRGERVRVYSDDVLYNESSTTVSSIKWSNVGLPSNYNVLLAPYGKAFVPKGEKIVSHGGISIEEVIVPFVKVEL